MMNRFLLWMVLFVAAFEAVATDAVEFDYMMNCQGCHLQTAPGSPRTMSPLWQVTLATFWVWMAVASFWFRCRGLRSQTLTTRGWPPY